MPGLWQTQPADVELIHRIAERGAQALKDAGIKEDLISIHMDIECVHSSCPLDLEKFLQFDEFNFIHDFGGIRRHLDRETQQLTDCFLPRCTQ